MALSISQRKTSLPGNGLSNTLQVSFANMTSRRPETPVWQDKAGSQEYLEFWRFNRRLQKARRCKAGNLSDLGTPERLSVWNTRIHFSWLAGSPMDSKLNNTKNAYTRGIAPSQGKSRTHFPHAGRLVPTQQENRLTFIRTKCTYCQEPRKNGQEWDSAGNGLCEHFVVGQSCRNVRRQPVRIEQGRNVSLGSSLHMMHLRCEQPICLILGKNGTENCMIGLDDSHQ